MNIEHEPDVVLVLQSRHSIPTFEPLIPFQVNIYQMYSRYIDDVPSIIVSLYLGPLSGEIDSKAWDGNLPQIPEGSQSCWFLFWGTSYQVGFSNKLSAIKKHHLRNSHDPYLSLPQLGCQVFHLWEAFWKTQNFQFLRFIWLSESYILFGGYSLLNIAMYGYIGKGSHWSSN